MDLSTSADDADRPGRRRRIGDQRPRRVEIERPREHRRDARTLPALRRSAGSSSSRWRHAPSRVVRGVPDDPPSRRRRGRAIAERCRRVESVRDRARPARSREGCRRAGDRSRRRARSSGSNVGICCGGSGDEQLDRLACRRRRGNRYHPLTLDTQRLTARGEDRQSARSAEAARRSSSPTSSSTCSQLSSTSSIRRAPIAVQDRLPHRGVHAGDAQPRPPRRPGRRRHPPARTRARRATRPPRTLRASSRADGQGASRVFPTPPGPVRVTSRDCFDRVSRPAATCCLTPDDG